MEKGKKICEFCGLEQDISAEKCSECGTVFSAIKSHDSNLDYLEEIKIKSQNLTNYLTTKTPIPSIPKNSTEYLGWKAIGMYFVYWLIPAMIFCFLPVMIIDPNNELSWTTGYAVGVDFFFFILAYPLAKIWYKKQLKKKVKEKNE